MHGAEDGKKQEEQKQDASQEDTWVGLKEMCKQNWSVLMKVGAYVMCLNSLRSSRKLIVAVAGEKYKIADIMISVVMTTSFTVDTLTCPVAGVIMDYCGRLASGVISP